MAWASFLLSVVPSLLKITESLILWANERDLMDRGRREAIAEAAQSLNSVVSRAAAAAQEAAEKHASDPTDNAFDKDFWRKDG